MQTHRSHWTQTLLAVTAAALFAGAAPLGCDKKSDTATTPGGTAPAGTAPGETAAAKPHRKVGVTLLTLANPYFKVMQDAMVDAGTKAGYDVTVVSGDNDSNKQANQVKDFLVAKVAAIVITPVDSKSIGTAIAEANKAGVPVFTADIAALSDAGKVTSHTATDNAEGGRMAARAMVEAIGGKGNVAIIDHPEVESVILRARGFAEEIAKTPGVKIVARLPSGGDRQRAFGVAQDILQSHPNLVGIFAINDPSALGAISAIDKAGKAGRIKVIGFDGQPEARRAVKDGKMYATVLQHPEDIAAKTIDAVGKYMAGEEVPKVNLIPTSIYRQADAATDPSLTAK